jgi:hypothetical protein
VATIVRGRIVMRDGELIGSPSGRIVTPAGAPQAAPQPSELAGSTA